MGVVIFVIVVVVLLGGLGLFLRSVFGTGYPREGRRRRSDDHDDDGPDRRSGPSAATHSNPTVFGQWSGHGHG